VNGFASARMPSQPFVVALIGVVAMLVILAAAIAVLPLRLTRPSARTMTG